MNQLYKRWLTLFCLNLCVGFLCAQTHTAKSITINSNCGGFYEYLPQGYNTGQLYPLMIYLHGDGDRGNGSQADLAKLLEDGPTKYINTGAFPNSFTVNGQSFKFILISPQFILWPNPNDIEAVMDYVLAHYPVDRRRIYITGMSMGGGVTWDYAGQNNEFTKKIAAIVPVCGASSPNNAVAGRIARENLPVWATHNQGDNVVPVGNTDGYVNLINTSSNPPSPLAKKTIFPVSGHDAWTTTYDPAWTGDTMNTNIYQWMLQFERSVVNSPTPVTLTSYQLSITGNKEVAINWTTSAEEQNQYFTIERSVDGSTFSKIGQVAGSNRTTGSQYQYIDPSPVTGNNFYRLSQTDFDGTTTYFTIKKATIIAAGKQLTLFPNPVQHTVTISVDQPWEGAFTINIIDARGKVVQTGHYQKTSGYWQKDVQLGQLPAGTYWMQIRSSQWSGMKALIKQ